MLCFLMLLWPAQAAPLLVIDTRVPFSVSLPGDNGFAAASIRESAIAWHSEKDCYYLIADVIPVESPRHPNTYETEMHLWRSEDLREWAYLGVAVPKGQAPDAYDAHGVASPSAMANRGGRLYVAFSARKTPKFDQRSIGLAWSGEDPEVLPWTKSPQPISDLPGEDDDPGVLVIPGDDRLHCYHRTTGGSGYRIVHTASATPTVPESWPVATDVTARPEGVRAQELTGAAWFGNAVHLFVIEQGDGIPGIQIAHLMNTSPDGLFESARARQRYLEVPPGPIAYGGHFTPVLRDDRMVAAFWTMFQDGQRYGLAGHPAQFLEKEETP